MSWNEEKVNKLKNFGAKVTLQAKLLRLLVVLAETQ
jgi:DNA-binding winged helix-turn-helix (wHTH) protein